METFSALLAICAGNSSVPGEFPTQRPVTRSFDVFFDLRLNKRLSKQSWDWWFETLSRPLWRHRNGFQCSGRSSGVFRCDCRCMPSCLKRSNYSLTGCRTTDVRGQNDVRYVIDYHGGYHLAAIAGTTVMVPSHRLSCHCHSLEHRFTYFRDGPFCYYILSGEAAGTI